MRNATKKNTHLDELVPASRDDDGVLGVGGEADARDPLGVALVGDGVLAVTEGVPELDGSVARTRDDLTVVGGERDGKDVVGVADEAAGGDTGGELPQAESLVPGRGESVGAVRGDDLYMCALAQWVLSCRNFPLFPQSEFSSEKANAPARAKCGGNFWMYVRSRRQCGSGREGSSWGSRTRSRRGSSSR